MLSAGGAGPIVGGIIDAIAGITSIVAQRIGHRRREWTQLVAEQPRVAALMLDNAAEDLEGSAEGLPRWRRGARRRRLAKARALRDQATNIRRFADGLSCESPMRRPL